MKRKLLPDSKIDSSDIPQLPGDYEIDDGQLTAEDMDRIRKAAEPMLPNGRAIKTRSLL